MKLENLQELFLEELADLHNAETQLIKALPKMAKAASDPDLRNAFEAHLSETQQQLERLESIRNRLDRKMSSKTCKAMKGLIDEGEEMIASKGDPAVVDAGLIAAAQRVEHYEIAAYGCARTYAELLGDDDAVQALETSLAEEKAADQSLNDLALQVINARAAIA
jgi:ferritin-like metal-binding protein YciE